MAHINVHRYESMVESFIDALRQMDAAAVSLGNTAAESSDRTMPVVLARQVCVCLSSALQLAQLLTTVTRLNNDFLVRYAQSVAGDEPAAHIGVMTSPLSAVETPTRDSSTVVSQLVNIDGDDTCGVDTET